MEYRLLGSTGMKISALGFGCSRLGSLNSSAAAHVLEAAFDSGINFFDTADSYGQGRSESALGEVFRGRRDQVIIATKAGYIFSQSVSIAARLKPLVHPLVRKARWMRRSVERARIAQRSQNFSAEHIQRAIDSSLKRLRTDYVDVFLLHSPPRDVVESGDFVEILDRAKAAGKIRAYGVSCVSPEHVVACLKHSGINVVQLKINLLDSAAVSGILQAAHQQGVGVVAREALASGLLAGSNNRLTALDLGMEDSEFQAKLRNAGQFGFLATNSRSMAQAALKYALATTGVSTVITGALNTNHLKENVKALDAPDLAPAEMSRIRTLQCTTAAA